MFVSALTTIFSWYRALTEPRDFEIERETLEYTVAPRAKREIDDPFWDQESKTWDGSLREYITDVKHRDFRNSDVPQNVLKPLLRTKYWYAGKVYKRITSNLNAPWPPVRKSMGFTMPIVSAFLCDEEHTPVRDVTEKIRRYAGPHVDFHGERVRLSDLLYYDDDVLLNEYPYLKIQNLIGNSKFVKTIDGFTSELQF